MKCPRTSEVHAARVARVRSVLSPTGPGSARGRRTRWQPPADLLELRPRRHLLGVDRGLDAVEEALEPADQLRLRDPELGVGRYGVLGERQGEPLQLLDQLGREPGLQLLDRG